MLSDGISVPSPQCGTVLRKLRAQQLLNASEPKVSIDIQFRNLKTKEAVSIPTVWLLSGGGGVNQYKSVKSLNTE